MKPGISVVLLLITFSLPIAAWAMETRAQQKKTQMRVGDISKFPKPLIFVSSCDLNVHGVPGNRPLVRVLSEGKGSHFLGKVLNAMGLSELYTVAC